MAVIESEPQYTPFLKNLPIEEPLMWVIDANTGALLDATPAAESKLALLETDIILRTHTREQHLEIARTVVATGESHSMVEWVKYKRGGWRKVTRITSCMGSKHALQAAHDITHLDPRAPWLARICTDSKRLELVSGESISFDEFVVLHLHIMGVQHKPMAKMLNISPKTVEYRLSRLKLALGASTTQALMAEVVRCGLIHLVMDPLDIDNPPQNELELYQLVPN